AQSRPGSGGRAKRRIESSSKSALSRDPTPSYADPSRFRLETSVTAPRLVVIVGLILALLAAPLPPRAQRAGKIARVGFLAIGSPQSPYYLAFRQGMQDLGYNEQDVALEARFSPDARGLDELAVELAGLPVEVIVVVGGAPAAAARRATKTIPIV